MIHLRQINELDFQTSNTQFNIKMNLYLKPAFNKLVILSESRLALEREREKRYSLKYEKKSDTESEQIEIDDESDAESEDGSIIDMDIDVACNPTTTAGQQQPCIPNSARQPSITTLINRGKDVSLRPILNEIKQGLCEEKVRSLQIQKYKLNQQLIECKHE